MGSRACCCGDEVCAWACFADRAGQAACAVQLRLVHHTADIVGQDSIVCHHKKTGELQGGAFTIGLLWNRRTPHMGFTVVTQHNTSILAGIC